MKISIKNKTYHNKQNTKQVIKDFELQLNSTGMFFLLGQSGCGKTTLINIISGQDTDFEGSIQNSYSNCYVTQSFELFESMSVIDNLVLVNEDYGLIHHYLNELEIASLGNQKVHTLSNGEKQRVQFIQALLQNKEMLICDEPTTALNIELRYKIMNILKEYAKQHLVLISTHDLTLAHEYADHIIEYNQGSFVEGSIKTTQQLNPTNQQTKRSIQQELKFTFKYLFSRKMEFTSLVLLLLSSLLTLFITLSMFINISSENDWKVAFKRMSNYIITDKINSDKANPNSQSSYIHTRYKIDEIEQFVEDSNEIIAVEVFSNYEQFGPVFSKKHTTQSINEVMSESNFFQTTFGYVQHPNGFTERREITDGPFLKVTDKYTSKLSSDLYLNNRVHFFDLVNGYELPLLYGRPASEGSAVIPLNFANYLIKLYQLKSVEELVNNNYDFFVVTNDNITFKEKLTDEDYQQSLISGNEIVVEDNGSAYEPNYVTIKISGISSIELPTDYYALFFNDGFMNNIFVDTYIPNIESYDADYLNLFVDPNQDISLTVDNLNNALYSLDCLFYRYAELYENDLNSSYQNIYPYFIFLNILIILIFVVFNFYIKNREIKEKRILMRLSYTRVRLFKEIFTYSVLSILFILSVMFFANWINSFAQSYHYSAFIGFDLTLLLITLLSVVLGSLVIKKGVHHD